MVNIWGCKNDHENRVWGYKYLKLAGRRGYAYYPVEQVIRSSIYAYLTADISAVFWVKLTCKQRVEPHTNETFFQQQVYSLERMKIWQTTAEKIVATVLLLLTLKSIINLGWPIYFLIILTVKNYANQLCKIYSLWAVKKPSGLTVIACIMLKVQKMLEISLK